MTDPTVIPSMHFWTCERPMTDQTDIVERLMALLADLMVGRTPAPTNEVVTVERALDEIKQLRDLVGNLAEYAVDQGTDFDAWVDAEEMTKADYELIQRLLNIKSSDE
jgi:hypothetical protein